VALWRLASSSAPNLHRRHLDASQRSMVPARLANMPRGGLKEGSRGSDPRLLGLTMGGYLIAHSGSDPVDQRSTAPRVRPIPKLARLWAELRHVPMKMALRGCKRQSSAVSPFAPAAALRPGGPQSTPAQAAEAAVLTPANEKKSKAGRSTSGCFRCLETLGQNAPRTSAPASSQIV
jgi:hypothetical protein